MHIRLFSTVLLLATAAVIGINAGEVLVRADDPNSGIQFIGGGWGLGTGNISKACTSGARYYVSSTIGASWSFTFNGIAARVNVLASTDRGIIAFDLDGVTSEIDTYSYLRGCKTPFQSPTLENGAHTLKATFLRGSPQQLADDIKDSASVIVLESIIYSVPDNSGGDDGGGNAGTTPVTPPTPVAGESSSEGETPSISPSIPPSASLSGTFTLPPGSSLPSELGGSTAPPSPSDSAYGGSVPPPGPSSLAVQSGTPSQLVGAVSPNTTTTGASQVSNQDQSSGANTDPGSTNNGTNVPLIAGCVAGAVTFVVGLLAFLFWRRRRRAQVVHVEPLDGEDSGHGSRHTETSSFNLLPRSSRSLHHPEASQASATTTAHQEASPKSLNSLHFPHHSDDMPWAGAAATRPISQGSDRSSTNPSVPTRARLDLDEDMANPVAQIAPWEPPVAMRSLGQLGSHLLSGAGPGAPSEAAFSDPSSRLETTTGDGLSSFSGLTVTTSMVRTLSDTHVERLAQRVVDLMREEPMAAAPNDQSGTPEKSPLP